VLYSFLTSLQTSFRYVCETKATTPIAWILSGKSDQAFYPGFPI
jgi:hypothetical protein